MGLKLRILSRWTPKFVVRRELFNVSNQTISALASVLVVHGVGTNTALQAAPVPPTSVEKQRAAMAQTHAQLVDALYGGTVPEGDVHIGGVEKLGE